MDPLIEEFDLPYPDISAAWGDEGDEYPVLGDDGEVYHSVRDESVPVPTLPQTITICGRAYTLASDENSVIPDPDGEIRRAIKRRLSGLHQKTVEDDAEREAVAAGQPRPDGLADLTDGQRRLVEAAGNVPQSGKKLARTAALSYHTARHYFPELVRRGFLAKCRAGYTRVG